MRTEIREIMRIFGAETMHKFAPMHRFAVTAVFALSCFAGKAQYENLDAYLERMAELKKYIGTVMLATDDKILYEKATGPAAAEPGTDGTVKMNTPESAYRIGSITKPFTAVMVLKSAENGVVSLDDKLAKWHPEVRNAEQISLRQMLSHTSGIPSYTDLSDMKDWKYRENRTDEMIIRIRDLQPEFEPGTRYKYSNSNYFLLGSVLEKLYNKPYEALLEEMVTGPLGMKKTGIDAVRNRIALSEGLSPTLSGWNAVPPVHPSVPYAAGALYCTANDLHTFSAAVFSGGLFKEEATLSKMKTPVQSNYGLGLFESEAAGEFALAHNGGIDGYSSTWMYFPDKGLHLILLSNNFISDHSSVADAAVRIHRGESTELPQARASKVLPLETLNKYAGAYSLDAGFLLDVRAAGGGLSCQIPGQERVQLQAANDTVFFSQIHNLEIVFTREDDGSTAYLTLEQAGYTFKGEPFNLPDHVFEPDAKVLARLAGDYEIRPGFDLRIFVRDGVLMGQATGQGAFELIAESETRYFATVAPIDIEFERDDDGRATGLKLRQAGQVLQADRKKEGPEGEKQPQD